MTYDPDRTTETTITTRNAKRIRDDIREQVRNQERKQETKRERIADQEREQSQQERIAEMIRENPNQRGDHGFTGNWETGFLLVARKHFMDRIGFPAGTRVRIREYGNDPEYVEIEMPNGTIFTESPNLVSRFDPFEPDSEPTERESAFEQETEPEPGSYEIQCCGTWVRIVPGIVSRCPICSDQFEIREANDQETEPKPEPEFDYETETESAGSDRFALNMIQRLLDGLEWDSGTIERIAEWVRTTDRTIADPNDQETES